MSHLSRSKFLISSFSAIIILFFIYGCTSTKNVSSKITPDNKSTKKTVSKSKPYNPNQNELPNAAFNGNLVKVNELLAKGVDVNIRHTSRSERTALLLAEDIKIIEILLKHGASINLKDNNGYTKIHIAAGNGNNKIIALLLQHGAEVNTADNDGRTPIHKAAGWGKGNSQTVELILKHGGKINGRDEKGITPLMTAISNIKIEIAKLLLAKGADPNLQDKKGYTPLYAASIKISAPLKKGEKIKKDKYHMRKAAERIKLLEIIDALIVAGADVNILSGSCADTPLHWAASMNKTSVVKKLLAAGADPNLMSTCGRPLRNAGVRITIDNTSSADLLLDSKATVTLDSDKQWVQNIILAKASGVRRIESLPAVLDVAKRFGNQRFVDYLISIGVDPKGDTAYLYDEKSLKKIDASDLKAYVELLQQGMVLQAQGEPAGKKEQDEYYKKMKEINEKIRALRK